MSAVALGVTCNHGWRLLLRVSPQQQTLGKVANMMMMMVESKVMPECTAMPDLWFSNDPADEDFAASLCGECPLQAECAAAGADEEFGVWGGVTAAARADVAAA